MSAPAVIISRLGPKIADYSRRRPGAIVACATTAQLARDGAVVRFTRHACFFALLATIARPGAIVPGSDLFKAGYGDDAEGGPLSPASHLIVPEMRAAAAALGFRITAHGHRGWSAQDVVGAVPQ